MGAERGLTVCRTPASAVSAWARWTGRRPPVLRPFGAKIALAATREQLERSAADTDDDACLIAVRVR